MGRNKKLTNKELTAGILHVNDKLDNYFLTHQALFRDYVAFKEDTQEFQKFLEKKYEHIEKQDTKKSK